MEEEEDIFRKKYVREEEINIFKSITSSIQEEKMTSVQVPNTSYQTQFIKEDKPSAETTIQALGEPS